MKTHSKSATYLLSLPCTITPILGRLRENAHFTFGNHTRKAKAITQHVSEWIFFEELYVNPRPVFRGVVIKTEQYSNVKYNKHCFI